ncbi:hypothetical protein [Dictyobacter alpinus]|uniref:hypothetical protein n=1 Tax=Dictyobacter alpinus TaxID=2014873 RepID=UPI001386CC68|nr:hypothetical protein [Dictyobacter alpinus]
MCQYIEGNKLLAANERHSRLLFERKLLESNRERRSRTTRTVITACQATSRT